MNKRLGPAVLIVPVAFCASTALAQPSEIEIATLSGMLDRSTTGVGAPLLDQGYDTEVGVAAGGELSLFFETSQFAFSHGLRLAGLHARGAFFGLGGAGFEWTQGDLDYSARALLPCMSDDDVQWHASAQVGLAMAWANGGYGSGDDVQALESARTEAAEAFDHVALGLHVGAALDVTYGAFLVGIRADVREMGGVRTDLSRTSAYSVLLRLGARIDLADESEPDDDYDLDEVDAPLEERLP